MFLLNHALICLRPAVKRRLKRFGVSICIDGGIWFDLPSKYAAVAFPKVYFTPNRSNASRITPSAPTGQAGISFPVMKLIFALV